MRARHVWTLILSLCAACAKPPMPPAPTAATRCTVPGVGSPQVPWRQVRASGFTFCVPPYWRPDGTGRRGADANTWYGDTGSLTWGAGRAPVVTRDVVVAVPIHGRTPMRIDPRDFGQPCSSPVTFAYDIGDATISTTQWQCQGTFTTSAICNQAGLYVTGEARTAAGAAMQLAVLRTIRLAARTP